MLSAILTVVSEWQWERRKKKPLKDVAVSLVSGLTLCFQNRMCARGTVGSSSPLAGGQGTSKACKHPGTEG